MNYYLLSVWKKNGQNSYSLCCSTSEKLDDLLYNMTLYTIQEDEMYVICLIENGDEMNQGGNVSCSWYYDNTRKQIEVDENVNNIIKSNIDNVLALQSDVTEKYKNDKMVIEEDGDIQEICPHCNYVNGYNWDGIARKMVCKGCGKEILLCSLCDMNKVECGKCPY